MPILDHWSTGIRDTTEFPSVNVEISVRLREHLNAFCRLDGLGWSDYNAQGDVGGLNVTDQRIRSYRKMYEKLGLVYKEADKLRLSKLGKGISDLESEIAEQKENALTKLRVIAIDILSRYQLRNPTENLDEIPESCDVLPFICVWKAMIMLDNKLHHEEVNRAILRVMKMADLEPTIEKIRLARQQYTNYRGQSDEDLTSALGLQVHDNQPEARIAAWFSLAGWGGSIIEQQSDSDGFRHLNNDVISIINNVIQNPPTFYNASNIDDWFTYYLGSATVADIGISSHSTEDQLNDILKQFKLDIETVGLKYSSGFISRFIASCLSKQFVIFTGLSGSGKTKLAQAFARWITKGFSCEDPFAEGKIIQSERIPYKVVASDKLSVEFWNSENPEEAKRVVLPKDLILEWVKCIKENGFTRATPARTIREKVALTTKYSTQLNSFETHFKAAAFAQIASESKEIYERKYEIVSVGADWTSKDNILGYPDALDTSRYIKSQALSLILKADKDKSEPYFLILDEMNLSHVERYFADILSALESCEPINLHSDSEFRDSVPPIVNRIPENLFIIGTINVDETTYMFSPKVLDRANVIEFTVKREEMESFIENPQAISLSSLDNKGKEFGALFTRMTCNEVVLDSVEKIMLKEELLILFDLLSQFGAEFGFRTVKEIARFIYFHKAILNDQWEFVKSMDAQIVQKILPKLHGSRKKLEPLLCAMSALCYNEHSWVEEAGEIILRNKSELLKKCSDAAKIDDFDLHPLAVDREGASLFPVNSAYYKVSYEKIIRMIKLLDQNGFVSFAEA